MNSKNMLYYNSEKLMREKTFAYQFTESEHLEEKTFTESPLAKQIGVAHYNFNFHGTRVALKQQNSSPSKVFHHTILCE